MQLRRTVVSHQKSVYEKLPYELWGHIFTFAYKNCAEFAYLATLNKHMMMVVYRIITGHYTINNDILDLLTRVSRNGSSTPTIIHFIGFITHINVCKCAACTLYASCINVYASCIKCNELFIPKIKSQYIPRFCPDCMGRDQCNVCGEIDKGFYDIPYTSADKTSNSCCGGYVWDMPVCTICGTPTEIFCRSTQGMVYGCANCKRSLSSAILDPVYGYGYTSYANTQLYKTDLTTRNYNSRCKNKYY